MGISEVSLIVAMLQLIVGCFALFFTIDESIKKMAFDCFPSGI